MIRELRPEDVSKLKSLHERHFEHLFPFPNFFNKFLAAFCVVDEHDNIITAGGVRTLIECVALTDKDRDIMERKAALLKLMDALHFAVKKFGYEEMHAFVQDAEFTKLLKKYNFRPIIGDGLVLDLYR